MKYRITCLTPTLVGDGQRLAPVDYMVWKDQVNVLDQRKIFKLLAKGPRLDNYLAQLKKSDKLDFASWGGFAQNFAGRRIPFEHASMTPFWERSGAEHLFIPTFAATARGPYLPASALKGALRTGAVFARWTHATMEDAARRLETERSVRRISTQQENAAIGASGNDRMRFLMVADSSSVPSSVMKIYLLRVSTLVARGAGKLELAWKVPGRSVPRPDDSTPLFAEMAVPGTTFEGGWSEKEFLKQPEIAQALHWRKPDRADVFKAANAFAQAQLAAHETYADTANLSKLAAEIARLKSELAAAESARGCLLSIGWAGGFLSKAGYLDLTDESFRTVLRSLPFYSRAIQTGLPFPKTRKIIFLDNQPATLAGWVRVTVA
jgi:CRISPR-associated protein Csm5